MLDLNAVAISKYKLDKAARASLLPGTYDVDITVRIVGPITVGEDYNSNISASVKWQALLALALSKSNAPTIEALVRELDDNNDISLDAQKSIAQRAQKALDTIVGKTNRSCKGKVTDKLTFTEKVTETATA